MRVLSARSEETSGTATLQVLVIFCGAGLLISLLLAMAGWI
ncbi:hypothetical protein ACFQZO_05825 [Bradyrhizobium sp. GCM10027634]|nr:MULTISPECIES: hypothetical protein [unclassified Bradyrhizobium]MDN5000398.1 hypothetical protein [Bradyrhizobium sp. WYCCWR 12677]